MGRKGARNVGRRGADADVGFREDAYGDSAETEVLGLEADKVGGGGGGSAGSSSRFHILQPNRDPESNWEVDLAKNLEEYLLMICSGELAADDNHGHHSVNFAEAALLLQGSVQVYSRKVEYLYTLVLHALEFISQKRQDNHEDSSIQPDKSESSAVVDEGNENFLGLDDIPEEAKNCLDSGTHKDDCLNQYVKPPANLVVLEGDCLDTSGEGGELESYLLSTCNFFGDFLLLDPCDAGAVQDFLRETVDKDHNVTQRGSSVRPKTSNPFLSPAGRSGGSRLKSSVRKKQLACISESLAVNLDYDTNYHNEWSRTDNLHDTPNQSGEPDAACSDGRDSSDDDDDDPWKPLNPHEPGSLKVKPFKKAKHLGKKSIYPIKHSAVASEFPIAKLDGVVSPEFADALELCRNMCRKAKISDLPPLYEKLRQSLVLEEHELFGNGNIDDDSNDNGGENDSLDFETSDFDMPQSTFDMDKEPFSHQKQGDATSHFDKHEPFDNDALDTNASLEDLCRSHLDSLLASIAESEKQTELATRVSTWKHRIEHTLEEQDSRPHFDIHLYGEKVVAKLSSSGDSEGRMCFTDVVRGQEKHDVARTFSALLQLVNNRSVDLERRKSKHESLCYTSSNPFYVKLLHRERRKDIEIHSSKKRVKSPLRKVHSKPKPSVDSASQIKSSHRNGKFSVKLGKGCNTISSTPESKRRRRSRLIEPFDTTHLDE